MLEAADPPSRRPSQCGGDLVNATFYIGQLRGAGFPETAEVLLRAQEQVPRHKGTDAWQQSEAALDPTEPLLVRAAKVAMKQITSRSASELVT